jgi:hypothetical protein
MSQNDQLHEKEAEIIEKNAKDTLLISQERKEIKQTMEEIRKITLLLDEKQSNRYQYDVELG